MDEQVINFSLLTELGLFGIFGPTGSGKSTILDAITLALYGEIPRSGKDLSGVINSHCDKCNVYYEFEIGSKNDKRRYFVSRSFKKDKQGSVRTQGVKLCDITITEEPIVLEEKVNSVNNSIAEIIGLRCNDFTRSVVLPQGNFSDFLKLSGRDKRDMLERIFALQEYGSQLAIKIKAHKRKVQEVYNFIEGNLRAYEGVSQESYDNLIEETKLLQEQYTEVAEQFKQIEKNFEYNKELYGLSKEYQGYVAKDGILKKQEENIKTNKRKYELAERAKNIQPYIEQQNSLEDQLKDMELDFEKNKRNLDKIKEILNNTREKWEIQQGKKENQIPLLLEEKGKMEYALGRKLRLEKLIMEFKSLDEKRLKYKEELNIVQDNLKKSSDKIIEFQEKLKGDQKKVEDLQISSQYRQKLYEAHGVEKEYKKSLNEEKEVAVKIKKITSQIQPLKQENEQLEIKVKELDMKLSKLKEELQKVSNEIQDIEHKNMAAVLAKDLEAGHSCPVCGSKEHPLRAEYLQGVKIDELLKSKKELEEDIELIKTQLEEGNINLQKIINQITLKEGFLQQWQEKAESLKNSLIKLKLDYYKLREELDLEDVEKGIKELQEKETILDRLQKYINVQQSKKEELEEYRSKSQEELNNKANEMIRAQDNQTRIKKEIDEIRDEIEQICGERDPQGEIDRIKREINIIEAGYKQLKKDFEKYNEEKLNLDKDQRGLKDTLESLSKNKDKIEQSLAELLFENGFENVQEVMACFKTQKQREDLKDNIKKYEEQVITVKENLQRLERRMAGNSIGEEQWKEIQKQREEARLNLENKKQTLIEKNAASKDMEKKLKELKKTLKEKDKLEHKKGLLDELERLFKGNKFVEFISMGQLKYIAREASQELKKITRGRYALELDIEGNFIMRDDFNGGVRRGTQTLSGGETFLTSLALALALSSHIQLKGRAPLEFFFLDEGFGTLDSSLLETVMDSLEKLHSERLSVGLISHVDELKQRIPRKLIIDPAESGIGGTRVTLEKG